MAKKRSPVGTSESLTPEHILTGHTPEIRELCETLRRLLQNEVPEAIEVVYPSWHGIGYHHPQCGYFCAIFPMQEYIKLGFEFGVLLPDPEGLLTGDGKQIRYVVIQRQEDIRAKEIRQLIQAAISLPPERDVKLWMIKNQ